jgi:hypothetical protein
MVKEYMDFPSGWTVTFTSTATLEVNLEAN